MSLLILIWGLACRYQIFPMFSVEYSDTARMLIEIKNRMPHHHLWDFEMFMWLGVKSQDP